jgi:DNA-binding MarR family transcriptional regulator
MRHCFFVISTLINYKSTYIMRKIGTSAGSPAFRHKPKRRKPGRANKSLQPPGLAGPRPPPPGQGKRGEYGYLTYLLRQAQAATRLTLERALADVGVTPPQFVVLTMLRAYPGLSGADLARVALLTPQTVGVIIRNLERDGAIGKTPHPMHGRMLQWTLTHRGATLLGQCQRHAKAPGAAAGRRAHREDGTDDPALAVQNCRRPAAGWSVFKGSMPSDLIRGWKPVRVKKTRQIKNLEPRFDSIETEEALVPVTE